MAANSPALLIVTPSGNFQSGNSLASLPGLTASISFGFSAGLRQP